MSAPSDATSRTNVIATLQTSTSQSDLPPSKRLKTEDNGEFKHLKRETENRTQMEISQMELNPGIATSYEVFFRKIFVV